MAAVIPVRAGSRRLKNKNIAPFAGTTLLQYKIRQLQRVNEIDKIVVTSDSDLMLELAASEGALTHKRAPEYCDEKTKTFGEVVAHVCDNVMSEDILWATCTSPLVEPAMYSKAIRQYYEDCPSKGDSLVSFEMIKRYLWNEEGPINYELGVKHVPSQQLPPLYIVTDGILIAPRLKMIEWKYFHGSNPVKFLIDKKSAVDVDDGLDLACARAWLDFSADVSPISPFSMGHAQWKRMLSNNYDFIGQIDPSAQSLQ